MKMNKASKIDFYDCQEQFPDIPGFDYCAIVVDGIQQRAIRTKSKKGWPRESFIDPKTGEIHIISYDSGAKEYILESGIRVGKGFERQEARMTVKKIKEAMGKERADSMLEVVEALIANLTYNSEGFADKPVVELERQNPAIDPKDPIAKARGAHALPPEKRDVLRKLMAQDPVEKKDLPPGMMEDLTAR